MNQQTIVLQVLIALVERSLYEYEERKDSGSCFSRMSIRAASFETQCRGQPETHSFIVECKRRGPGGSRRSSSARIANQISAPLKDETQLHLRLSNYMTKRLYKS